MNIVFSICAWFFGIIFICIGLAFLLTDGNLLLGIPMLIGAVLLLPPIKNLIIRKKNVFSRGKVSIIGTALIFIGMFFMETGNNDYSQSGDLDKAINDQADEVVTYGVSNDHFIEGFDTSKYKHIAKENAAFFLLGSYLKLIAENLSDEEFLTMHNVEDFSAEDSFKKKRALDNVNSLRQELIQSLEEDAVTDKIAVDFVSVRHDKNQIEPQNIDSILGDNFKITNLNYYTNVGMENAGFIDENMRALFILEGYDHERKEFSYDINGPVPSCSTEYYGSILEESIPNIVSAKYGNIYTELDSMDTDFSEDCSFKVDDPSIASKIEAARVAEKLAITGTNYYTLSVKPTETSSSYNPYQAERLSELYGLMDAYVAHIRIIQEDGSLSEPLASNFIVSPSLR